MNKDQAKGKWRQIKGVAKKAWGELTDDDFKKAEGSADKLYGLIQEKYGDTKEAIKLDFRHFGEASSCSSPAPGEAGRGLLGSA